MFICGDDASTKSAAGKLASELGFDVVDAGPLTAARLLEPLAMLWIHLGYKQGLGATGHAFKLAPLNPTGLRQKIREEHAEVRGFNRDDSQELVLGRPSPAAKPVATR